MLFIMYISQFFLSFSSLVLRLIHIDTCDQSSCYSLSYNNIPFNVYAICLLFLLLMSILGSFPSFHCNSASTNMLLGFLSPSFSRNGNTRSQNACMQNMCSFTSCYHTAPQNGILCSVAVYKGPHGATSLINTHQYHTLSA